VELAEQREVLWPDDPPVGERGQGPANDLDRRRALEGDVPQSRLGVGEGQAAAESLRRQQQVAETQRRRNQPTKAVVAVGSWDPPRSQLSLAVSQRERELLRAQGACAELCANLLDADGQPVATDFTDRCITITTGQLRTVDEVIAVGGGQEKTAAFRAVLNGGYATSVVTDVLVARGLLDQLHR
jgi:DNA-binding transcriptional regulator LsrR (DeoR family)